MAGIKQLGQKANITPRGKQDRWLLKSLDDHLTKKQSPPRQGVFFPSLVSNTCDRYVYMAYVGLLESSTIDGTLRRIFDTGGSLEDRINKYLTSMGILEGREISLKNETPPISGRMDFLIKHEKYGLTPIELKSINARGFENLRQAKPDHILQLHTYMNLWNANRQLTPVTHGIVLYENKNTQKLKAFVEELDDTIWSDILSRLFRIMNLTQIPEKCTGDKWCKCKENYGNE
jgi:hypothetical protein